MRIETLLESLPERFTQADRELIQRAYETARKAHEGQIRTSGEEYVSHCISVAAILTEMKVPPVVIAAGLLHDTVEDTTITLEDLRNEFGEEIAKLVDGVTKLTALPQVSRIGAATAPPKSAEDGEIADLDELDELLVESHNRSRRADLASETLRKTFLAMSEDVRVVLIKLADRLHNMRTLGYCSVVKQKRIAQQTLDIFAPLASRLGIWQMKWELEDLSFRYQNPDMYKEIAQKLAERRSEREQQMSAIIGKLENLLSQNNLKGEITGRPKHIYSIYKKMARKDLPFEMIRDVRAVRIILEDVPSCYTALGLIHTQWRPIPGEFDDYIAAPKDNFYQSLHTAVLYDDGKTLEVQLRTQEMHQNAEYGIAAHWRYKEGTPRDEDYERRVVWLRTLMDWMQDVDDASEFMDSMKTDVFSDRVYAFTPAGDIIDLPAGSTPIDFAYHVHTSVGHRCRGAKVNGKLVPLDYQLKTGDQVEILTAKKGGPSRDWLNSNLGLVKTQRSRSKVRHWFKTQDREQNITFGKAQIEKELNRLNISNYDFEKLAREFDYRSAENLFASLGCGDVSLGRLVNHITLSETVDDPFSLTLDEKLLQASTAHGEAISIWGLKGLLTTMGKCCNPAPGDEIVGYITRGRGATIHRADCPNVMRVDETDRLVRVSWSESQSTYPISIKIKAYDREGLIRDVSNVIAEEGISMGSVSATVNRNQAVLDVILNVKDIAQLSRVLTRVENLPNVMQAYRVKG
ncbi:MAG: bifunctional (p)ppGpp synthetase/guanosine-3',5'-bis(diphosphate) 3'-pyrophosphohydrolase [Anaerolineales bacterium]|nr:bifunctional (p)ppGpp synthetase/guanosine-3',5'-bis(diphosphate) 3'-pyrophosphohydrolase [Anaerolineales bacterium]